MGQAIFRRRGSNSTSNSPSEVFPTFTFDGTWTWYDENILELSTSGTLVLDDEMTAELILIGGGSGGGSSWLGSSYFPAGGTTSLSFETDDGKTALSAAGGINTNNVSYARGGAKGDSSGRAGGNGYYIKALGKYSGGGGGGGCYKRGGGGAGGTLGGGKGGDYSHKAGYAGTAYGAAQGGNGDIYPDCGPGGYGGVCTIERCILPKNTDITVTIGAGGGGGGYQGVVYIRLYKPIEI